MSVTFKYPTERAEAMKGVTTPEDGFSQLPGGNREEAVTAASVAPMAPPSPPEQKPASEKTATGVFRALPPQRLFLPAALSFPETPNQEAEHTLEDTQPHGEKVT